jgi:hypothetical protein
VAVGRQADAPREAGERRLSSVYPNPETLRQRRTRLAGSVRITGWSFWFGTFTGLALLLVVALPFSLLAVSALARWRSAHGATTAWAWRTALTDVGIVHGTVPWVWMTLLPGSRAGGAPGRMSLVPTEDLLVMGLPGIIGNLLIFAALGFFAPMRVAALASLPRVLALAAGCSFLIEVAQYVFQLDRVSSVDDVLLNAAGAGLGAIASHPWWRTTGGDASDSEAPSGRHRPAATSR